MLQLIKKSQLLLGLVCVVGSTFAQAPEWVVMGVQNFSYNMVCCLVDNNIPCTVLTRPGDTLLADAQLPQSPLINRVEVDYAASQRPAALDTVSTGAKYLFLDPEDNTFATWHETVLTITRNALYMAKKNKLTIIYPARIYPFSAVDIITEKSTYNPSTAQGRTLTKIEYMLKYAADHQQCKVRKIRTSYAFGPAVYDYLLSSTFKDVPTLGRMTWLFRTDKPHQFCYTYDIARLALLLSTIKPELYDFTVHFSGYTYQSVEAFGHAICAAAGTKLHQRIVGKFLLSFICLSEQNAERGADLSAYFDSPIHLEDSDFITNQLQFQPTPPAKAFKETLEWFKKNPETRNVAPKN
ncbi:MAG: hypothetical protein QG604_476 [Candidatus Dependentiae bacterium]|nr:hypothetical protein [Candidatus Dependentiae bacterium]